MRRKKLASRRRVTGRRLSRVGLEVGASPAADCEELSKGAKTRAVQTGKHTVYRGAVDRSSDT